jgi:hypothetical protein
MMICIQLDNVLPAGQPIANISVRKRYTLVCTSIVLPRPGYICCISIGPIYSCEFAMILNSSLPVLKI